MYKEVRLYGKTYTVEPSTKKNKKYDVYLDDKYLLSFGDIRYQQYKDRLGYYSKLNHNDPERRDLYKTRHHHDHINDPNYPGFWSWWFLW